MLACTVMLCYHLLSSEFKHLKRFG